MQTVNEIVSEFADKITTVIEDRARQRAMAAIDGLGNGHTSARRGRPPKAQVQHFAAPPAIQARKPAKVTPAQTKARKLQGVYLGNLRQLSAKDKKKVQDVRAKRGVEAAIKLLLSMKKAAGKAA